MKTQSLNKEVGRRIAERRDAAGITQNALARAIGVHPVSMNRYEKGVVSVTLPLLVAICKEINCTPNDLFGF